MFSRFSILTGGESAAEPAAEVDFAADGKLALVAREDGDDELRTASGKTWTAKVAAGLAAKAITGPWQLAFPPKWGAPASVTLTNLVSWTEVPDEGVRHFSGMAAYRTAFELPEPGDARYALELGEVMVMARVKVNGRDCGIAWRPPFRVDVTDAVRAGRNELEIQVANLWLNRMIGDAALPREKRFTWSSWEPFNARTPLRASGLLGPVRLVPRAVREPVPAASGGAAR